MSEINKRRSLAKKQEPCRAAFPRSLRLRSAQRNTYLTGFCLFLSLVLTRTFYIILDLIHTQEEYAKLKNSVRPFIPIPLRLRTHSEAPQTGKSAGADQTKQIEELKKKLAAAEEKTKDYGMSPILLP